MLSHYGRLKRSFTEHFAIKSSFVDTGMEVDTGCNICPSLVALFSWVYAVTENEWTRRVYSAISFMCTLTEAIISARSLVVITVRVKSTLDNVIWQLIFYEFDHSLLSVSSAVCTILCANWRANWRLASIENENWPKWPFLREFRRCVHRPNRRKTFGKARAFAIKLEIWVDWKFRTGIEGLERLKDGSM